MCVRDDICCIAGDMYLVTAAYAASNSPLYKFNVAANQFQQYQSLAVVGA